MRFCHFTLIAALGLYCGRIVQTSYYNAQESAESSRPKNDVDYLSERDSHANELFDSNGSTEILSIELEFTERGVNMLRLWKRSSGFSGTVKVETLRSTDPHLLKLAIHAFSYRDCYRPFPNSQGDETWMGGDLGMPYALLRFETRQGIRIIGLSRAGFTLGEHEASRSNGFFSPAGADFVNLLFIKKHSALMPVDLLDGLSGRLQLSLANDQFQLRREALTPEEVK